MVSNNRRACKFNNFRYGIQRKKRTICGESANFQRRLLVSSDLRKILPRARQCRAVHLATKMDKRDEPERAAVRLEMRRRECASGGGVAAAAVAGAGAGAEDDEEEEEEDEDMTGGSLYNTIVNPKTGRRVSIYGRTGKQVLKQYLKN